MATLNVYYNAGTNGTGWTNPSRAWDGSTASAADRVILPGDGETYYLRSQTVDTSDPGGSYSITKVEIGLSYKTVSVFDDYVVVRPIFGGTTNGTTTTFGGSSTQTTEYADITEEAAGPGIGNWTWSNISGLDIKTWGLYSGSIQGSVYVYEVWIRMTYDTGFSRKLNGVSDYSKINGKNKTSITKLNNVNK
jgi:hypothetical protein